MEHKKLKAPFSKYEISESGNVIRNIKAKSIVSLDKGVSIRLVDDNGNRVTINKKDFATKLIPDDVVYKNQAGEEIAKEDEVPMSYEEVHKNDVEVVDEKPTEVKAPKLKIVKKEEAEKPKPKLKIQKPAKVKKPDGEKRKSNTVSSGLVKKGTSPEKTPEIKAILDGEGSKASKMKQLYKINKSITQTAMLLETHYSYVYNMLIWYPEQKKLGKK